MKQVQSDDRFIHFTDCEIRSLYKKVPKQFGGFLIQIYYKEDEEGFFGKFTIGKFMNIEIDQSKFAEELINFSGDKEERLYYTDGMTNIDIFKQGDKYVIYWSPNDSRYCYFFFSYEEFNKLKTWLELENK